MGVGAPGVRDELAIKGGRRREHFPTPHAPPNPTGVKVDIKEPLNKGDTGVDEVDFAKIGLEDALKYLNVSVSINE